MELYIKHKSLETAIVQNQLATQADSGDNSTEGDQGAYINLNTDYMNDFVLNFERKEAEKKALRIKKKGLENFVEEPKVEE